MSQDESILWQLDQDGRPAPRVRLEGAAAQPSSERYRIVGEIARGGVGVVYKGHDTDLGRDVAMKVLREGYLNNPDLVQRFVEEAQIGGQLQHPGIVPVYELGLQDKQRPFFAMKLVKGRTLTALLGEGAERRTLLTHFAQACHTVAYAHSRGVIHRDLKPANIMVGAFGEVQVVDWGFAKVLRKGGVDDERRAKRQITVVATVRSASEGSASVAGDVMGTPAYMPPEQALGQVDDLTERSDVFSLGAILCEILTGKPPYGEDALTAAAQGRLDEAYQRIQACGASAELQTLCKQCLSPLPKDRPRNAREVADALTKHLAEAQRRAHRSRVRAAKARAQSEEKRRARRQTLVLAAAILGTVSLVGGGFFVTRGIERRRERERTTAFEAALQDASRLHGAMEWANAKSAIERAVGLAPERRSEVSDLQARIEKDAASALRAQEKADAEARLLAKLDEISLKHADHFDAQRTDDQYAAALPDVAAFEDFDRKQELAAHFDDWALLRRYRKELRGRDWRSLDVTARALDPDSWRNGIRDAAAAGDGAGLRKLAAELDPAAQSAQSVDLLALALDELGARDAAAALLRRAWEAHPGDLWIHYHLALFAAGPPSKRAAHDRPLSESVAHYTAAVALRPTSGRLHYNLGYALVETGDIDGGIAAYRAAVRLETNYAWAYNNLGLALRRKGDLDLAIAAFAESIRLDSANARAYSNLGGALTDAGDLAGAIDELLQAIRLDPSSAAARYNLGNALKAKGDDDGAIAAYREAIRLDPKDARPYTNLGSTLRKKGDLDRAIARLREAIQLDPSSANAYNNLGATLASKGELDRAIAAYREATRLDPKNATAHVNLGNAILKKGDVAGAITRLREAIRLNPNSSLAYYNLSGALARQGDLDGALATVRTAVRLDPKSALAHGRLGWVLRKRGEHTGCIEASRVAIRLDSKPGFPHTNLGISLLAKGDVAGAVAACREGARLDPKTVWAHVELSKALTRTGDHAGAAAALKAAVRLDPRNADCHFNLGQSLRKSGDPDGAIAAWRKAVQLNPTHAYAHGNLGFSLVAKGDLDGGIELLRRAVRLPPASSATRQGHADALRRRYLRELQSVLNGGMPPADARTRLGIAELCFYAKRYKDAVRLFKLAFETDPKASRYLGACAAAMAGEKTYPLARTWLRSELEAWRKLLPKHKWSVATALKYWRDRDDAFENVCPAALEDLPAAERKAWQALWADVDVVIAEAQ